MFAHLLASAPVSGAAALLAMSGGTQDASAEERRRPGSGGRVGGGASSQKLSIGFLLCDEEDHPPRAAGAAEGPAPLTPVGLAGHRHGGGDQPTTSAASAGARGGALGPPGQLAASTGAVGGRPRVGRDRAPSGGSGGSSDERAPPPPPPPPRRQALPPGGAPEADARLPIPPLRLRRPPGGVGADWPPTTASGGLGGGPHSWSPPAPWPPPAHGLAERPLLLPVHTALASPTATWHDGQEGGGRQPRPSDPLGRGSEEAPGRDEWAKDRDSQAPGHPTLHADAADAGVQRKRLLPPLWQPPPPSADKSPPADAASATALDLPRQRPYAPVEGRVGRVSSWPRPAGGVGSAVGLPYPPLRSLHSTGRGLQSLFRSGLPPLLPQSSAPPSLVGLRSAPPPPLQGHHFDQGDAATLPTKGALEGARNSTPAGDPLLQLGRPGADIKESVPEPTRTDRPPRVLPVKTDAVPGGPAGVEAPSGPPSGLIFPSEKPELDPVRCAGCPPAVFFLILLPSLDRSACAAIGICVTMVFPLTLTLHCPSSHAVSNAFYMLPWPCFLFEARRSQRRRTRATSAASAFRIAASYSPTSATCTNGRDVRLSVSAAAPASGSGRTSRSTLPPCTSRRSRTPARCACTALAAAAICTLSRLLKRHSPNLACALMPLRLPDFGVPLSFTGRH